jgi:Outer membrane protein beta-barrel domain
MLKNVHKKLFPFLLSIIFSFALNAQQIDSSKRKDIIANIDTSKKWATVSFGLNVGYAFNKTTATGWFEGQYATLSTPSIGLTLKLNIGKKWSIGTAFNRYNMQFTSIGDLTKTLEVPSTIAAEPNFLLEYKGRVNTFFEVIDIPFELSYKFNKIKKYYIPIISVGTSYIAYNSHNLQDFSYDGSYIPRRISGSKPVEDKILHPSYSGFSFSNKNSFSPFVIIGVIRSLSEHSFVRLNAKCALNQNTTTHILQSKVEEIIISSNFKTLQMGLNAEYFITF